MQNVLLRCDGRCARRTLAFYAAPEAWPALMNGNVFLIKQADLPNRRETQELSKVAVRQNQASHRILQ